MTKLIGFQIYQTENINIQEKDYTIRFSLSNDGSEYALLVSNPSMEREAKYFFTKETADDFKLYNQVELKEEVVKIIQSDIENGLI
jgi:hypothetical protein